MSFHSKLSPEIELHMTDPKLTVTMTVMVTLTPSMMDHGKELSPNKRLLHSQLHRTHCTPTSFHSRPFLETESPMIDPKLTDITIRIWVTLTPNTMVNGKEPSPKQPHLPLHKTHCTPTNSHSRPSPETESLMTDPKLTATTIRISVTSTPNMTVNGKETVPYENCCFLVNKII